MVFFIIPCFGAHRIVLCIRLTLLTDVRRNMSITWCKTSKMVTREQPMQRPKIPPTLATNQIMGIF